MNEVDGDRWMGARSYVSTLKSLGSPQRPGPSTHGAVTICETDWRGGVTVE